MRLVLVNGNGVAATLGTQTDPQILKECSNFFMASGKPDKALDLAISSRQFELVCGDKFL